MPGTCHTQAHSYCRHEPEKHPLYQILAQHLETFLQRTRTDQHQLPHHVEQELRAYLKCGILNYGFVRVRCEDCGESRAVAFSDGVYATTEDGDAPVFVPAPAMSDEDVQLIVETAAGRIVRLLQRRGILDDAQVDELADGEPLLAAISAASVQGQLATGERAGKRVRRVLADPAAGRRSGPLCFAALGRPANPPTIAPARPPPQQSLDFAA